MISDMKELSVKAEISAKENVLVDYVILMTDIKHSYAGDLAISLTSPAGTTSVMSLPRASVDSEAQVSIFSFPFFFFFFLLNLFSRNWKFFIQLKKLFQCLLSIMVFIFFYFINFNVNLFGFSISGGINSK